MTDRRTIVVAHRFNGPPASGNGGYVGGLLAQCLGAASVEVTLRAPPPLDTALDVRPRDAGGLRLMHDDRLLAEAVAAPFTLEVPPAPPLADAAAAGALGRLRAHQRTGNPYRRCIGCGIDRDDGLRLLVAPVGDDGRVATDWTPDRALAQADGTLPVEIAWIALDCPAGLAWSHRLPDAGPLVTARIAARVDAPVRAGEPHVVYAWPIARDGRKLTAGSAIARADGQVLACSLQLWLLPRSG